MMRNLKDFITGKEPIIGGQITVATSTVEREEGNSETEKLLEASTSGLKTTTEKLKALQNQIDNVNKEIKQLEEEYRKLKDEIKKKRKYSIDCLVYNDDY